MVIHGGKHTSVLCSHIALAFTELQHRRGDIYNTDMEKVSPLLPSAARKITVFGSYGFKNSKAGKHS